MTILKTKGVLLLILSCFSFCVAKHEFQTNFPVRIDSVFYQHGKEILDSDKVNADIHIIFKKALPNTIQLEKVYFRNQESRVGKINEVEFVAPFFKFIPKLDLILDSDSIAEYGNQAPVITKPKFILNNNEAVLEYKMKNKTYFFKIINIKER